MEEPQQSELIYWDKHRIPINLTILFSLGVAIFGVFQQAPLLIIAGIAVGLYSWLTNPRQYRIYRDSLVIIYGTPRTRTIHFSNISHLEMRQLATPDRLRVWPIQGRRVVLMAHDPEAFHDQLQKALDDFRRLHPELAPSGPDEDFRETPETPREGNENRGTSESNGGRGQPQ